MKKIAIAGVAVAALWVSLAGQDRVDFGVIEKIRAEGMERSKVLETFDYLTSAIGPRLTNSPAHKRAVTWTQEQMKAMGLSDVHAEELRLDDVVPRIAQRYGFADVPIEVHPNARRNVWIDKLRLERILANLLDNARQHGGGPTKVTIEPDRTRGLLLAVEDAGPGVARGERQRIFERFARGTAARHRVGTGLGLALVAEHAHALGGEAWVEDRIGGGARFVVRFPLDRPGGES